MNQITLLMLSSLCPSALNRQNAAQCFSQMTEIEFMPHDGPNHSQAKEMPDKALAINEILKRIQAGDSAAQGQLFAIVYDELKSIAREKMRSEQPGHTLQATALVHEAFARLGHEESRQQWQDLRHFFNATSEAMRRILVDHARSKQRIKRGGDRQRVSFELNEPQFNDEGTEILIVNELLEQFEEIDLEAAQIVKVHYFTGRSIEEIASDHGIPRRTAYRKWTLARGWFKKHFPREQEIEKDSGTSED